MVQWWKRRQSTHESAPEEAHRSVTHAHLSRAASTAAPEQGSSSRRAGRASRVAGSRSPPWSAAAVERGDSPARDRPRRGAASVRAKSDDPTVDAIATTNATTTAFKAKRVARCSRRAASRASHASRAFVTRAVDPRDIAPRALDTAEERKPPRR